MPTPTPPQRAFVLKLDLQADARHDMVAALMNLADRIDRDEAVTRGVWGGSTTGAVYELTVDPNQTHEKWKADLDAYLKAISRDSP